jgi:hypothetical protein
VLKSSQDIPEQLQKKSQIRRLKLLISRDPKRIMKPRSTDQESLGVTITIYMNHIKKEDPANTNSNSTNEINV